jgi:hypothetical protein
MGEVLWLAIRVVQATAGELSQPMAICIPCKSEPSAVISRSELVMVPPLGFDSEATELVISWGHWTRQTSGSIWVCFAGEGHAKHS